MRHIGPIEIGLFVALVLCICMAIVFYESPQ